MPAHQPAEIHALFERAFNQHDEQGLIALYEPNAILVLNGRDVKGRESIREAFESLLPSRGRMTLEARAVVESPDGLAVLHGGWSVEPAAGMEGEIATRGLSTEVVRQQPDGTWLFVIDSPNTPV